MRALAVILAASLIGGCAANSYRIPPSELSRLTQVPPAERGQRVRVIQELSATPVADAERVGPDTEVIVVPRIDLTVSSGGGWGGGGHHGSGGHGGGGGKGVKLGSGSSGKGEAIAILVVAAAALFVIAGVEGSRFDGWAQLHPMHPVHLIGKDGGYAVRPLAWLDPATVAWTEKAIIKPYEGPWRPLERAPLWREGGTYGMYAGTGSLYSAHGDVGNGAAFTIQAGYFFNQYVGLLGDIFFGWRQNQFDDTLFESRFLLELQAMPLRLGIAHLGGYVGTGVAYRFEDNVLGGNDGSEAYTAGGMLQLDINTRIALTARAGVTRVHDERTTDLVFGMSVY